MIQDVQEHFSVGILVDTLQYWLKAAPNLGQKSKFGSSCFVYFNLILMEVSLQVRNGHIKRITDNDIQSLVLEIISSNVSTTFITCPADPKKTLGIKLPFLVMIIKNLKKYFTFEVQVS